MKKFVYGLLISVFILTLVGCAPQATPTAAPPTAVPQQPQQPTQESRIVAMSFCEPRS